MTARMRAALLLSSAACLLLLAGCGTDTQAPPSQTSSAPPPEISESVDLYAEIIVAAYTEWAPAPGYSSRQSARGPHGEEVQIFIDPTAEETLAGGAAEWPTGAIIAKDIYRAGELIQIAAMKKTDGGWYWGEWDALGEPIAEGLRVEPCEGCHASGTDGTLGVTLE
ncbi:MAG: hypothetical protein U1E29_11055 [Coriobacteriia bacterium]|nr:hypothetical protein [Coriobacteriia bacterium]